MPNHLLPTQARINSAESSIYLSIYLPIRCHRSLREASGGAGGAAGGCQGSQGPCGAETLTLTLTLNLTLTLTLNPSPNSNPNPNQGPCGAETGGVCGWAVLLGALVWRDMMMAPSDVIELQIREQQDAERRDALQLK